MLDTLGSLVHLSGPGGLPKGTPSISQFLMTTGKERALSSTSSGALEGSVETSYPHSLSTHCTSVPCHMGSTYVSHPLEGP